MADLSVVIITKNVQNFIARAVLSADFADEILVLDSGSSDKTCHIAKMHGARVEQHVWLGFGKQKNTAVALAKNDWVFVLDADEKITKDLAQEIISTLKDPDKMVYQVARLNYFFGKILKRGGLYPDYSIRLFHRNFARFNEVAVHESVQTNEQIGRLNHPMVHQAYQSIEEFISKQNRYSTLSIKKKSILKALLAPAWVFFKMYILKLGFLDGWYGFVIARLYAQYTFWKYSK